jgi:hypothetical protein
MNSGRWFYSEEPKTKKIPALIQYRAKLMGSPCEPRKRDNSSCVFSAFRVLGAWRPADGVAVIAEAACVNRPRFAKSTVLLPSEDSISHSKVTLPIKGNRLRAEAGYHEGSGALTMIVPENWVHQSQLPDFRSLYEYGDPQPSIGVLHAQIANVPPPPQGGIPWGTLLLGGGLALLGLGALTSDSEPKKRYCGACGRAGHTRNNCPFTGQRANF